MQKIVNILLIENSTAGNPPKLFEAQHVKIKKGNVQLKQGVDGKISPYNELSEVLWIEGNATDFDGITDVKITSADGDVLLDGELNSFYNGPKDTDSGVKFFVL